MEYKNINEKIKNDYIIKSKKDADSYEGRSNLDDSNENITKIIGVFSLIIGAFFFFVGFFGIFLSSILDDS